MTQSKQLLGVSRSEKHNTEEIKKNTCFICGLERKDFDNKNVTFEVQLKAKEQMTTFHLRIMSTRSITCGTICGSSS